MAFKTFSRTYISAPVGSRSCSGSEEKCSRALVFVLFRFVIS